MSYRSLKEKSKASKSANPEFVKGLELANRIIAKLGGNPKDVSYVDSESLTPAELEAAIANSVSFGNPRKHFAIFANSDWSKIASIGIGEAAKYCAPIFGFDSPKSTYKAYANVADIRAALKLDDKEKSA